MKLTAAVPAEPALYFEPRQPEIDENDAPLLNVPIFPASSGVKDSVTIKVPGEVKGLSELTNVKITNLIASTREVGSNQSVSFRDDRIEIMRAQA